MTYSNTASGALEADQQDPLHKYRSQFLFPTHAGKEVLYFTGNSLGLQPRKAKDFILEELEKAMFTNITEAKYQIKKKYKLAVNNLNS
jgi:kynureninase